MLRFRTAAIATVLVFGLIGGISIWWTDNAKVKASGGRSFTIPAGSSHSALTDKGILGVAEQFNVDFKGGTFFGFYRDVPLSPEQTSQLFRVEDSDNGVFVPGGSAELGSFGSAGQFGTAVLPEGRRIVWHVNTTGRDVFKTTYTLDPVGDRYANADFLDISIWGDQWGSRVGDVTGSLTLPKALPSSAEVAVTPQWLDPALKRSAEKVSVAVKGVPPHQAVRLQISLPHGWLPGKVVSHSGSAPSLPRKTPVDSLRHFAASSPLARAGMWAVLILLIGELPIVGWFAWNRRRLADAPWDGAGPVYEPPAGESLSFGYSAANETQPPESTALVATLMDLVARGFYTRENIRDERSGDWRLQIALPSSARTQETFSRGEKAVLKFVDLLLADGPCVVDDLAERVDPSNHRAKFQDMQLILVRDGADLSKGRKSANWWVKLLAGVWFFIAMWIVLFLSADTTTIPPGVTLSTVGIAVILVGWQCRCVPQGDFIKSPPELSDIQGPWRGWRDFILHFDQFETAPDLGVVLWERAFAGALMWGVAKEFVNRAKVLAPELSDGSWALANSSFYGATWGSAIGSAAVPASSSGGSFGGGSFGGGGGGGAW